MSGNRNAPLVESSTLMAAARDLFPCASVTFTEVNPQHKSWRIEIRIEAAVWLELFWGPLSGFGATDLYNQKPEGGGLFDPYDVSLDSVGAAIKWLNEKSRNQN
jgi:hypothetical protein